MVPVVLFVYNRPLHTKEVLKGLEKNNIDLLYVFSDAAKGKPANSQDAARVEEIRKVINQINWTETRIVKQKEHKGLAKSVIEGVSLVLDKYDKIIVLEDDCVPSPGFYSYMGQCLEHYQKEEQISCVSAYLHPINQKVFRSYPYDLFFWRRFWSWGWGTWLRVWEKFNPDLESLINELKSRNLDTSLFGNDVKMGNLIEKMQRGEDTWATPFFLKMVLDNTFSVYPVESYIKNIGFDGSGSHCAISNKYDRTSLSVSGTKKELRFPPQLKENETIVKEMVDFINGYPQRNITQRVKKLLFKKFKRPAQ